MWCRTVRRLMEDFVAGVLDEKRRKSIRAHLERCGACRSEEQDLRLVTASLRAWPDEKPPSDGLHRLEGRLAFLPPPPERVPAGRLRTLVLPYVAGMATAAAILLLVGPLVYERPAPAAPVPGPDQAGPVAEADELAPGLLEGERVLRPVSYERWVDEQGRLRQRSGGLSILEGMSEQDLKRMQDVKRLFDSWNQSNQDH